MPKVRLLLKDTQGIYHLSVEFVSGWEKEGRLICLNEFSFIKFVAR